MFKRVIFLLLDGARWDVFNQLLKEGCLPTIEKYIVNPGTLLKGVTCFPSTTGPAYLPYLCGLFPGTMNIPGVRWLDKKIFARNRLSRDALRSYMGHEAFLFNQDMENFLALFDFFSHSATLFSRVGKSAKICLARKENFLFYPLAHYFHNWDRINRIVHREIKKWVREVKEGFLFAVIASIDAYSHLYSPFHHKTLKSYIFVNKLVGEIVPYLKDTLLILASDHGLSPTKKHLDLAGLINTYKRCIYYPLIFKPKPKAAEMVSGNGMSHLYFKNSKGWAERTLWEELEKEGIIKLLMKQQAIDFIAGLNEKGEIVVSKIDGEGRILYKEDKFYYNFSGKDPLGFNQEINGICSEEGLFKSLKTPYPDSLVQLTQIFKAERCGDLVVSAKEGFDLRAHWEIPEHYGTHGALVANQMFVPIAINTKVNVNKEAIRTVDIFPTILRFCGKKIPEGLDGRSLY